VFALSLNPQWQSWADALATPLHGRLAWRLARVLLGILLASGRRTVSSWFRAAKVGTDFRSYYYFLDSVGRKALAVAAVVLKIVLQEIDPDERLVFALDDTPTKRYGPEVQGAGIHHDPTSGPAGSKFLHGQSWVTLGRVAHHPRSGVIGLPMLGRPYVRKKDVPGLPEQAGIAFQTKLKIAAEMLGWLRGELPEDAKPAWVVVDGGYAKRESLRPAMKAKFVVVARLRKDAAIFGLPPSLPPGTKRGQGRPPIHGKDRLSLAKRAGQTRGWKEVTVKATTGREVVKKYKTFLATWRPAGGVIRVVILKENDGSWRAFLCTEAEAEVEVIVQTIQDRWAIEQNYPDLKEVEGIEQVRSRRVWSNVGALNLSLWAHALIEVWAWKRAEESLIDRSDRPWDDASRRPSHADRRRALRRELLAEEYRRLEVPEPWREKIRDLLDGLIRLAA